MNFYSSKSSSFGLDGTLDILNELRRTFLEEEDEVMLK